MVVSGVVNRPFPSSPGPLYQNEVRRSTFDMVMIFILMQIKLISTRNVEHLTSFSYRGPGELGNGLLRYLVDTDLSSG